VTEASGVTVSTTAQTMLNLASQELLNLIVPSGLGTRDVPLQAMAGGIQTGSGVVISLQ